MAISILWNFALDGNSLFLSSPLVQIYRDGGCQPHNPGGYACWGWIAVDAAGCEIAHATGCLGPGPGMTNNLAEAHAILQVWRWATARQLSLFILSESMLLANQVTGAWAVSAPHLTPLVQEVRALLAVLDGQTEWIRREANTRADALTYDVNAMARKGGWA
jgi:ribonuclease HI